MYIFLKAPKKIIKKFSIPTLGTLLKTSARGTKKDTNILTYLIGGAERDLSGRLNCN